MELLFQLYLILFTTVHTTWLNRAHAGKVSSNNVNRVIFFFSLFILIYAIRYDSVISRIFYITLALSVFIMSGIGRKNYSDHIDSDLTQFIIYYSIFLLITYLCILLMDYSNNKKEFDSIVLGVSAGIIPQCYSKIMYRIRGE